MPGPVRDHRAGTARTIGLTCVLALLAACAAADDSSSPSASLTPESSPSTEPPTTQGDAATTGSPTDDGAVSSTAATAAPATTDGRPPLEVTLAATGDMLAHATLNLSASAYAGGAPGAYDYAPMLAEVAPILSAADLTLCHLETPLSADNTALSVPGQLSFNTPYQLADALAGAGVDGCDFASNHTMDRGLDGLRATEQVMRDAGLGYAGPTADEERAGEPEVYEVNTGSGDVARLAHLAYTYTYPNDGSPTTHIPGEAPWLKLASWPSIGSEGILDQAKAARAGGADFVVVSMHWGQEYQAAPTADQTGLAEELLASGDVDLILGTHVHVIQPCDRISGKHVIYGLGNFLSNQSPQTAASLLPATQEGMVAEAVLTRDEDGKITTEMTYHPTRVEISPQIVPSHVVRAVTPETYPETWERTRATVDLLGGCGAEALRPPG